MNSVMDHFQNRLAALIIPISAEVFTVAGRKEGSKTFPIYKNL